MRIYFSNFGHAERRLKTCKKLLLEALIVPEGGRLPTQRTRNAMCKGFGYGSYEELRCLVPQLRDIYPPTRATDDLLFALAMAFFWALAIAREHNIPHEGEAHALSERLSKRAFVLLVTNYHPEKAN